MSAGLYHVGAKAQCLHVGQISTVSSNTRVMVSGMAVATMADKSTVKGCPFKITTPPPKEQPCMTVTWAAPALRVKVMGNAVLLDTSTGICESAEQIKQGAPKVLSTQPRVKGT